MNAQAGKNVEGSSDASSQILSEIELNGIGSAGGEGMHSRS